MTRGIRQSYVAQELMRQFINRSGRVPASLRVNFGPRVNDGLEMWHEVSVPADVTIRTIDGQATSPCERVVIDYTIEETFWLESAAVAELNAAVAAKAKAVIAGLNLAERELFANTSMGVHG